MRPFLSHLLIFVIATAGQFCAADETTSDNASQANVSVDDSNAVSTENCRIKLIDDVILASEMAGVLDFVEPQEGDSILKDQEVFALNASVPQAAYEVAKAEALNNVAIRFAEASHEVALAELQKKQKR